MDFAKPTGRTVDGFSDLVMDAFEEATTTVEGLEQLD